MKKYIALVLAAIMFFSVSTSVFAAAIGSQLLQPESGWKRIDDHDSAIKLESSKPWTVADRDTRGIQGEPYRYTADANAKVSFSFYGTKFRLLHRTYNTNRTAKVTVDGVTETYKLAEHGNTFAILSYEKTGLPKGEHTVEITYINDNIYSCTMDAVDIDEDGYMIDKNAPSNLNAQAGDRKVILTWESVKNASEYVVFRSTTKGGPYNPIANTTVTGATYETYTDTTVVNDITYYYVVKSVVNGVKSYDSNEASATPKAVEVTGERALITVTMVTGLEKEFDLSMDEVNAFITWYENKQAGSGTASYAIDKHNNNKGPFSARKDYVIFDKILTFEVNEYKTK